MSGWKAHGLGNVSKREGVLEEREAGWEGGRGKAIKEVVKPRVAVNLPTTLSCPTRTVMAI